MTLTTPIDIPRPDFEIAHTDRVMLLGSCFADEVGAKFVQGGFDAVVNPYGTLYNPASIGALLEEALRPLETLGTLRSLRTLGSLGIFKEREAEVYHSWMHHSRFSATSREELERRIDAANELVGRTLRECRVLIITLGTAIVYRLKESGMLVANCHKQPDSMFVRERLAVDEIVEMWQPLIEQLKEINPQLRIIFTVSPIRHKRDGMHVNQISKGILLQAVDELVSANESCHYFPAYEIMLDELRDYRFYADDMIHPSPLAVEYIWQRFQETFFSNKTRDAVAKANKTYRQSQHRAILQ